MEQFFDTLTATVPFIIIMIVIYLLGMVFFWYESSNTGKNRNSVFDMWFVVTIFMLFWGRVTYIIANWSDFSQWDWFWLPYQRFGEDLYVFRAMPWRMLSIWDGGFLFIPMFAAFLFGGYLYVVFVKKWRWREMFVSVLFTGNFLLGMTLMFYGIYLGEREILMDGFLIILFIVASHVLLKILKYVYKNNVAAFEKVANIYLVLFLITNLTFLIFTFLQQEISTIEIFHVYFLILLGIIFLISYLIDIRNPDKGKEKGIPSDTYSSVSLNQAIKVR